MSRAVYAIVPVLLLLLQSAAAANDFKVVALGDSFTEGWDPVTEKKTPYTLELDTCLQEATKGALDIVVENKGTGWSGVLMSEELYKGGNLTQNVVNFVTAAKAAGDVYDWVVIWVAGVNDLSNSKPPVPFPYADAVQKYKYLWDLCLAQGWNVLVMPQPTLAFGSKNPKLEEARAKLAALLKAAVLEPKNPKLEYLDLALILDGLNTNATMRAEYLSQGIHLTAAGYARVGDEVCKALTPFAELSIPEARGSVTKTVGGTIKSTPSAATPDTTTTTTPPAVVRPISSKNKNSTDATNGAAARGLAPGLAWLGLAWLCLSLRA